jgi:hypothetical protein
MVYRHYSWLLPSRVRIKSIPLIKKINKRVVIDWVHAVLWSPTFSNPAL